MQFNVGDLVIIKANPRLSSSHDSHNGLWYDLDNSVIGTVGKIEEISGTSCKFFHTDCEVKLGRKFKSINSGNHPHDNDSWFFKFEDLELVYTN